jgi:hypothetical protein
MYLIDPIPVTPTNGVLVSSTVAYPDQGVNPLSADDPMDWPRWARGLGYVYNAAAPFYVVHLGALFRLRADVPDTPPDSALSQLPPGHPDNTWPLGSWERVFPPSNWSADADYTEGMLAAFPPATYTPTPAPTHC